MLGTPSLATCFSPTPPLSARAPAARYCLLACLLLHVEETRFYTFIKQIITIPNVYTFLKSLSVVDLPMAQPLPPSGPY